MVAYHEKGQPVREHVGVDSTIRGLRDGNALTTTRPTIGQQQEHLARARLFFSPLHYDFLNSALIIVVTYASNRKFTNESKKLDFISVNEAVDARRGRTWEAPVLKLGLNISEQRLTGPWVKSIHETLLLLIWISSPHG